MQILRHIRNAFYMPLAKQYKKRLADIKYSNNSQVHYK